MAVNKIDHESADIEKTVLDLSQHGVDVEYLGGEVPCALISATVGTGIDELKQKIKEMSEQMDLKSD